jgi:simple sugar transport system ATP-binding protein|tara:strand:+ start:3086 stop:3829 length:744 start_codon:yes stop_codon:yes gene_type:complete
VDNGNIIECNKLNKWYSGVHALKDFNLSIKKDSVVGLIGDNGAGKSTLIKILSGAHKADSGQVFFEGNEVKFRSTKEAMNLGIETIYQYSALIPEMSIARNIFIGREQISYKIGSLGIMKRTEMDTAAMDALNDVELHLRSPETPVNQLSGGERQGVVIARAMYFKSKLLILDEPTNHLSVKETNKVLRFVEGLKKQGVTSIFITHNLNHIFPIADHLCVMARGEKISDMEKKDTTIEELTDLLVSG